MNEEHIKRQMEQYANMSLSLLYQEWNSVTNHINPNRKIEPVIECEPTEMMCGICRQILPVENFRFVTKTRRSTRCKRCEYLSCRDWKKANREMKL